MIYLRDDDVMIRSKGWNDDPFARFKLTHEWAKISDKLMHVPTLLVEELRDHFPQATKYIREETAAGRMAPELHGIYHAVYDQFSPDHVLEHLTEGADWMEEEIGVRPKKWYTPWGANAPHLYAAAAEAGLELVDCTKLYTLQRVTRDLREGTIGVQELEGREIFFHWWEMGLRVKRLAYACNYGSWQAAAAEHKELFGE